MLDKNGKEIKTGDVVEIQGAYFKNDNGMYYVRHSAGDPDWNGRAYSLEKIRKDGRLSKAKGNVGFWPIYVTVNDRDKALEADAWNTDHATVEVRDDVDVTYIADHFLDLADNQDGEIKFDRSLYGPDSEVEKTDTDIKNHYLKVARRLLPCL